MRHHIPERWKERVRHYLLRTLGETRDYLNAGDFSPDQSVQLQFEDGSFAFFRYAFCLIDRENEELAVFTEHCGYHFISSRELRWQMFESFPIQENKFDDMDGN